MLVQASFTALNIEPDDQIDDEVDNTKEIQVRWIPGSNAPSSNNMCRSKKRSNFIKLL
jgi:hypothetical protein